MIYNNIDTKKLFLNIFILFFLFGCATKQKIVENSQLLKISESINLESFNPSEFEEKIPDSSIIRNSLVRFEKTYQRIYSDSEVISISGGKSMLAVLKKDEIGFTISTCGGLYLKDIYYNVRVYEKEALIYNQNKIDVYSAEKCGSYGVFPRLLRGYVEIVPGHIIEWFGSQAALRDFYTGEELYFGETGIPIVSAGYINNTPVLLQENGYLLSYNKNMKAFVLIGQIPSGYKEIYHSEGIFYGILEDSGKFFVLDNNTVKISDDTNCKASPYSVSGICGNTLITDSNIYHDIPQANNFASISDTFISLEQGHLNIYYLEAIWQRFLSMGYSLPNACISDGFLYYQSFSGNIYELDNDDDITIKVTDFPENCNNQNVLFKNGDFYYKGKKYGRFSSPIRKNEEAIMYRRIEGNRIYYYFENVK